MKLERIEADTCDVGPTEVLSPGRSVNSTPRQKPQRRSIPPLPDPATGISIAEWRQGLVELGLFQVVEVVSLEEMGPVHLLGDDGGPRVCVGYGDTATFVWIERPHWGWSNGNKEYHRHDHVRRAVNRALNLARAIRKAALAEWGRRERIRAERLAERSWLLDLEQPQ